MQDRENRCCGEGRDSDARTCCPRRYRGQATEVQPPKSEADPAGPYVTGWTETPGGRVPTVSADLTATDRHGDLMARWGIGRMRYRVEPGLYALGRPNADSHVLVTANYKFTFDRLRRELPGLDAYIMVLDTRGINVWCAAGKGTFGTAEVVNRVKLTCLDKVVNHRNLILPQLSATGVAAHEVKRLSGFSVTYGPVRAADIIAFLDAGMVATREMRRVRFTLADRLALAPNDVVQSSKYFLPLLGVLFALSGIDRSGYSLRTLLSMGPRAIVNLAIAYIGGNVLGPALLPWLPGRAFALKGFALGLLLFLLAYAAGIGGANAIESAGWAFIMPAVSSFILMNFTGSSTYTSLSGVRREMVYAVPFQAVFIILGVVLWTMARFI